MYAWGGAPALTNVAFVENDADHSGGGFSAEFSSSPTLASVVFLGNVSMHQGGGLQLFDSTASLANVAFLGNHADHQGGALAAVQSSSASVANAALVGNSADHEGGAVALIEESIATLTNVTMVGNEATTHGGGIMLFESTTTLVNVTMSNNRSGGGGGLYSFDYMAPEGHPTFRQTNVWGNEPDDFDGFPSSVALEGTVSVDPRLLDVAGADPLLWDVHLSIRSPLVGAGDPSVLDPDGSRSDIGAYGGPGAGSFDLDRDGFFEWWQPGRYDAATYPDLGWDCDDRDAEVFPGAGC